MLSIKPIPCYLAQRSIAFVVKVYRKFDHRQGLMLVWQNIGRQDANPAFAMGATGQSQLDRTFNHDIDIKGILFMKRPVPSTNAFVNLRVGGGPWGEQSWGYLEQIVWHR
jgi:hypothetical protein